MTPTKTDSPRLILMTSEMPLEMEGRREFQEASQATLDDTVLMAPKPRSGPDRGAGQGRAGCFSFVASPAGRA